MVSIAMDRQLQRYREVAATKAGKREAPVEEPVSRPDTTAPDTHWYPNGSLWPFILKAARAVIFWSSIAYILYTGRRYFKRDSMNEENIVFPNDNVSAKSTKKGLLGGLKYGVNYKNQVEDSRCFRMVEKFKLGSYYDNIYKKKEWLSYDTPSHQRKPSAESLEDFIEIIRFEDFDPDLADPEYSHFIFNNYKAVLRYPGSIVREPDLLVMDFGAGGISVDLLADGTISICQVIHSYEELHEMFGEPDFKTRVDENSSGEIPRNKMVGPFELKWDLRSQNDDPE